MGFRVQGTLNPNPLELRVASRGSVKGSLADFCVKAVKGSFQDYLKGSCSGDPLRAPSLKGSIGTLNPKP